MGWSVPDEPVCSSDFDWYSEAAARTHEGTSWHSVRRFAEAAIGDLVWFRNLEGRFYLARLTAAWTYDRGDRQLAEADLVNYRPAHIINVGLADAVPGKIIACFRPSRTFQRINSPGMLAFSSTLAGLPRTYNVVADPFEFMSDEDLENLIFVYLQSIGWYVLPGTRTPTTAHYECVLVNRSDGQRAVVQVKSGHIAIDATGYAGAEKAFLFAVSDNYGTSIPSNVVIIRRDDLNSFMREMPHLLPRAVATWLAMARAPHDKPAER